MKKITTMICLLTYLSAMNTFAGEMGPLSSISSGFYAGLGASYHTTDEKFNSYLRTNTLNSAVDRYSVYRNRLAPNVQLGYWAPINTRWLWGISAQWNYLGYKTTNVDSSRGQHIPNATFSSINIFGPDVMRDFSSQTRVNNEGLALVYLGEQLKRGYIYFGLGPVLFTTTNNLYVSSVHTTPHGPGDHLTSTSVSHHKTIWGGAAQLSYNYYLSPSCFLGLSYLYAQSKAQRFNNSANTALLNGVGIPGPTTLDLHRRARITDQAVTVSINKVLNL